MENTITTESEDFWQTYFKKKEKEKVAKRMVGKDIFKKYSRYTIIFLLFTESLEGKIISKEKNKNKIIYIYKSIHLFSIEKLSFSQTFITFTYKKIGRKLFRYCLVSVLKNSF